MTMTPEELAALIEAEEREAIRQEGCGEEIDVVRRDTRTGERITTTEVRR